MHGERRKEQTPLEWRRVLRRDLAVLLALKAAALWLLWVLCFSAAHRAANDASAASRALDMPPSAVAHKPAPERGT